MDWQNFGIRILTIEVNATKRQMLNQELRSRGYLDVTGVGNIRDGLDMMKRESFDWALIPLAVGADPNGLAILEYALKSRSMVDLNISFLLQSEASEFGPHLKKSFELGLLNYFQPFNTKIDIEAEFKKLFDLIEYYHGYQPFIAAEYLRPILQKEQDIEQLLIFEKAINKLNCQFPKNMIYLAEAYCLNGECEKGLAIVEQAELLDSRLKILGSMLRQKYSLTTGDQTGQLNLIQIEKVVLVEPNDETFAKVDKLLRRVGIPEVYRFVDGESALEYLRVNRMISLILFEWQLPKLAGPIFGQRVRDYRIHAPLIVFNDTMKTDDIPILKEIGMTHLINTPLQDDVFYRELFWIVNQDRQPTEPHTILQKLKQALADNDMGRVATYKRSFFANKKATDLDKLTVNAEISYHAGFYHKAKQYALEALEKGGDSIHILNVLGKTLMQLREFPSALRCLENAQVISPVNIKRLCQIAESHLELENDQGYEKHIDEALKLDEDAPTIKTTEAKAAIKRGQHDKAKSLMQKLDSLKEIVVFTNNRAVALIRTDHYSEGVSLYEDAIMSMPEDERDILATLYYNIGLAKARKDLLDESLHYLKKADTYEIEKIRHKIQSLRTRVEEALINETPLHLKSTPVSNLDSETEFAQKYMQDMEALLNAIERHPGSHNLHMVYSCPKSAEDKAVTNMLLKKVS